VARQALEPATSGREGSEIDGARLPVNQAERALWQGSFSLQSAGDALARARPVVSAAAMFPFFLALPDTDLDIPPRHDVPCEDVL